MADAAVRTPPTLHGASWLRPLPPAMRAILYADAAAREIAAAAWDVPFPAQACRAAVRNARAALWLGPDEYLLLAPEHPSQAAALAALDVALAGVPHALVDVGHRQTAMEVLGPHAQLILNSACPLDLDLEEFPVDMCTRTVLGKADIVLWRRAEAVFHLETWRSFSDYVVDLLAETAREF